MIDYRTSPLLACLRGWGSEPPPDVQDQLLEQLQVALSDYYVHLPLKRSALAIDPVEKLRLMQMQGTRGSRPGFLRALLRIINGLRDRHTTLTLPDPWRRLVAYLPFVLERCSTPAGDIYVVTKQLFGFDEIPLGSVVSHWNGTPIAKFVRSFGDETQGANPAAALRLALAYLTIRPLSFVLMPQEDWVTLTFRDPSGAPRTVSTPWRFYQQAPVADSGGLASGAGVPQIATVLGLDHQLLTTEQFVRDNLTTPPRAPSSESELELSAQQFNMLSGKFRAASGQDVGYLRIFSFEVADALAFVNECRRILEQLPQAYLIVDIRGNPGGLIPAGQKLIRLLSSSAHLHPSPLAFRNTIATRRFGAIPMFEPWRLSLDIQASTGQTFSQTLPVTSYDDVPDYRYPGKVALIVDALCYSTSDFFTADFKDNGVGLVVGTDEQTGGGGANVWNWDVLRQFSGATGRPLGPLPGGFGLNLSMRRSVRTGLDDGIPVEDRGVEADVVCPTTVTDAITQNTELLRFTAARLVSS